MPFTSRSRRRSFNSKSIIRFATVRDTPSAPTRNFVTTLFLLVCAVVVEVVVVVVVVVVVILLEGKL